jgi:hypothetical protein
MKRLQMFFDYLASEDLRPQRDNDNSLSFEFERNTIFVDISESDDFIFFSTRLEVSFFDDQAVIPSALNEVVRHNRYLTGWHDSETVYLAAGFFCSEASHLGAYLYEVLYSLTAASEDLEFSAYDAPFFFEQIVNGSYANRYIKTESIVSLAAADSSQQHHQSREALLMRPSSETANKLRWEVDINGTSFSLYIPKRRVPLPWPRQIVVTVSASEIDTGITGRTLPSHTQIDPRLPIIAVLQREVRRKHTVRYRPIGAANTWEVGKPYIPYSLLPTDAPERIQLEVRWDFSAGTWST